MKKLVALSVIGMLLATTVAEARNPYNHNRNGYGYNRNTYVQNNYYGRRGNGWNNNALAAGIGGLVLGTILSGALSAPAYGYAPQPQYGYDEPMYIPQEPMLASPQCVQAYMVWNGYGYIRQYVQVC